MWGTLHLTTFTAIWDSVTHNKQLSNTRTIEISEDLRVWRFLCLTTFIHWTSSNSHLVYPNPGLAWRDTFCILSKKGQLMIREADRQMFLLSPDQQCLTTEGNTTHCCQQWKTLTQFITTWCYASTLYAVIMCPSVHPSVCLSVTCRYCNKTAKHKITLTTHTMRSSFLMPNNVATLNCYDIMVLWLTLL